MPAQPQVPPRATSRRTAWVLVIIMSTLFVLALLGTIWGFIRQAHIFMAAKEQSKATAPAAKAAEGAAASITLAPGARILSASTDSGKLVLHVATPNGSEVEIIDLATGRLTGQVKTQPAQAQ
jgi:flagellar basal body-associated protein FliL